MTTCNYYDDRTVPAEGQGRLPLYGQQSAGKEHYRARGCRGGANHKGRGRSESYNMRRDKKRNNHHHYNHHLDASSYQENDPHRLNRRQSTKDDYRNFHRHRNYQRNESYRGRIHPSNFINKQTTNESHDEKSRRLSILPDSVELDGFGGNEPTFPCDDGGATAADKAEIDLSPISSLPKKGPESVANSAEGPLIAVVAPISIEAKEYFSFFALSPSSFLTGKKASNGHSHL